MSRWPMIPLGNVLTHRKHFIEIDDLANYKRCRVQLHAQGIVLRDKVVGAEIKTKKQQVCQAGEFLVAEIDAKLGGYGIVPQELESAIVSSHYFLFSIDETKLERRFLGYFIRTPAFHEQVTAQGSTNYAAIRPGHVLEYQIPLPPLDEQRRVVERIDGLAAKIEETKRLRQESSQQGEALFAATRATIFQQLAHHAIKPLDSLARLERGKFSHRPRNEPRFFGGEHPWIQIAEIEASRKFITHYSQTLNDDGLAVSRKFKKGTLLISIAATIGAVGILGFDCCIPDSIVAVTPMEGVESEYLYHLLGYLRTHLEEVAPQSAQKNINLQTLSSLNVPIPASSQQRDVIRHLDRLEEQTFQLGQAQSQTSKELDAMLPAILNRAFNGDF